MRQIHPTWSLTVACLSVVGGVVVAQWLPNFSSVLWAAISGLILALCFRPRKVFVLALAIIGGCLLGLWRGSLDLQDLEVLRSMVGKTASVRAVVADDIDEGKRHESILKLKDLHFGKEYSRHLPGKMWVSVRGGPRDIKRSDTVTISGELAPGFASYSSSMMNAKLITAERARPGDVALNIRDKFSEQVKNVINEPMASLGLGYLLGQKNALPTELADALKIAGLTHIVVASGYNLTILVRLARRVFAGISKYLATIVPALLVLMFIAITGVSPSMSRAGLVSCLSLLAWYLGRNWHPVTLLSFVAALTVLINPSFAWGDLGWQLSFAAFAGVMILAPLLHAYFFGDDEPKFIRQTLIETISAQLATTPIIITAFSKVSVVAIFSNLLILPLIPLAMLLTFLAGLTSTLTASQPWKIAGLPAEKLLEYMVEVAKRSADLPWAQVEVSWPWWGAALAYFILGAFIIAMAKITKFKFHNTEVLA